MAYPYSNIYPGALHIHSVHSDGTGTIPEIARAAKEAGLRWIIITDHNTLAGRPEQGWYDDLLVLVELEVTPPRDHFLALEMDYVVDWEQPPQQYIDEIYAHGGWGVIAHPDECNDNELKQPYNWQDWNVDGPTHRDGARIGIELWNWMSDWAEQLRPRNKYLNFFVPHRAIRGPTPKTLQWWDRLNVAGKRTFGTGDLDSHATKVNALGRVWELFPYLFLFRTVTNYIWLDEPLSGDFDTARRQVLDALGAGHLWFANRRYGAAHNASFWAQQGSRTICVGEVATPGVEPITLYADTGSGSDLRLIRNGNVIATARETLQWDVEAAGVYRIEARRWRQPWLYSNPIMIEAS